MAVIAATGGVGVEHIGRCGTLIGFHISPPQMVHSVDEDPAF